jgi:MFS superfamily sulfate permease-like transporter
MEVVLDVVVDGLIIAIVAYTISISMANIFAHKHDYKVDANQELVANVRSYVLHIKD